MADMIEDLTHDPDMVTVDKFVQVDCLWIERTGCPKTIARPAVLFLIKGHGKVWTLYICICMSDVASEWLD